MAEQRIEPTLDLTVEGKSYNENTEQYIGSRTPATVHLNPESERVVTEPLRAMLAERLKNLTATVVVLLGDLDLTSPALPGRDELQGITTILEKAAETCAALREMAPTTWDDDDGDGDAPTPDPQPSEAANA